MKTADFYYSHSTHEFKVAIFDLPWWKASWVRVLEILDPCDRDFPAALENVSSQMASFVHGAQERASKSTESSNVTVSEQWARENFGWDEADFLQVLN